MTEDSIHEVTRYSIPVLKLEEPNVTWHNYFLSVRSHKGVHIFEFQQNLQNFDKTLISAESFVDTTRSSPASNLFTKYVVNNQLGNLYLNEMIVDQTLWPHSAQLMQEVCVTYFQWSPFGVLGTHGSVLAVLNNVGGVDLCVKKLQWICAVKLSESFSDAFLSNLGAPNTFHELRVAAHVLASTTVCWADKLNKDDSCFLATGQRSGNIMFWLVTSKQMKISATLSGYFERVSNEVVSLSWIFITSEKFLIICTDILGKIFLLNCAIVDDSEVCMISKHELWSYEDKMITTSIKFVLKNDKIIIFCNKFRFLLGFLLDLDLNILDQYTKNINDTKVTCIALKKEDFYVTTINSKIFKINISIIANKLNVTLSPFQCKCINPSLELHSIAWSHNSAICALGIIDRKIQYRKECYKTEVILATNHTIESLTSVLLENPTKKLTFYWDIVELLRCKVMKQKELPKIDYQNLYQSAGSDLYLLKIYLIFTYIYNNLFSTLKIKPSVQLPEQSISILEEEVQMLHAENEFKRLYNKYQKDKLDGFEMECFPRAKQFLEYNFEKNGKDIRNIFDSKMLEAAKVDNDLTCQSCDKKLTGFHCEEIHFNTFCMLTFTLIESLSYLRCNWCRSTSRVELLKKKPLCLFCDVDLSLID